MPTKCIVPGCQRRGGFSFPSDPEQNLKWRIAIKREPAKTGAHPTLWKPSQYSRVCEDHFKAEDFKQSVVASCSRDPKKLRFLKEGAVPSVFPWTSNSATGPRSSISEQSATSEEPIPEEPIPEEPNPEEPNPEEPIPEEPIPEKAIPEEPTSSSSAPNPTSALDFGREETIEEEHVLVEIFQGDTTDQGVQVGETILALEKSVQTRESGSSKCAFSIKDIKNNPEAVQFYTSFESYEHFKYVLHCLGAAAYHLDYKSRSLDTEDEFFLFMMKIRLNHEDEDLAFRFNISRPVVHSVFHTWLQFLYFELKETVQFIPKTTIDQHMPKDFKAKYPSTRVILDATEVEVQKPGNVVAQRATWSSYKNCNTLKTMIGISPKGVVTYISPSYGGSCSDRQIIERSELLDADKFCPGESIMADRGILVQDLFASKDVKVNTPRTMKGRTQLPADVVKEDRRIASKRVHVERIIRLAKTYKIISTKLDHSRTPYGGRIIFVCFALCNFRINIIPKHC